MPMPGKLFCGLILVAISGCVPAGKYDAAVLDAQQAKVRSNQQLAQKDAELTRLKSAEAEAQASRARTTQELESSKAAALSFSKSLDEATALNQQLRAELERQGRDVDQLLSTKGTLASSLEQARARLEELRRAQAAAEARVALFRDIALRLRRMVDAGELQIVLRSGRMVLALPTDILFDSGKAKIGTRGKSALKQVAAVLVTIGNRRFQVAGHTDSEPIRFSGFASNWELSSQRALEVVAYLIETGMSADTLSAAGYGEFDPVSANDTVEAKARNRRIEIALQPNIDELVPVPDQR